MAASVLLCSPHVYTRTHTHASHTNPCYTRLFRKSPPRSMPRGGKLGLGVKKQRAGQGRGPEWAWLPAHVNSQQLLLGHLLPDALPVAPHKRHSVPCGTGRCCRDEDAEAWIDVITQEPAIGRAGLWVHSSRRNTEIRK